MKIEYLAVLHFFYIFAPDKIIVPRVKTRYFDTYLPETLFDEMKITLDNLSIGYDKTIVASGINAALESGQLTCLLGANGAGKSTLLRTLSAFQPALDGEIRYDGTLLSDFSPKERAKMIGVVLTQRPQVQYMKVRELVGIGRAPYTGFWGKLCQDDEDIVTDAMQKVGISQLADRFVHALSDGERQKVMIAKALAQQTPVIFLDEPTAFLDFPSKVETMQLLLALCHDMGKIAFFSTHDVEIALQMSDRVWLMDKASGLSIGTPHELAQQGVIGLFVERPGVTFDPGTLGITVRGARDVRK